MYYNRLTFEDWEFQPQENEYKGVYTQRFDFRYLVIYEVYTKHSIDNIKVETEQLVYSEQLYNIYNPSVRKSTDNTCNIKFDIEKDYWVGNIVIVDMQLKIKPVSITNILRDMWSKFSVSPKKSVQSIKQDYEYEVNEDAVRYYISEYMDVYLKNLNPSNIYLNDIDQNKIDNFLQSEYRDFRWDVVNDRKCDSEYYIRDRDNICCYSFGELIDNVIKEFYNDIGKNISFSEKEMGVYNEICGK